MTAGFKQTEVGLIPNDWEVKSLKEIASFIGVGLVINPSSYFDNDGTIPMLVGSTVKENNIYWEKANRITIESNKKIPASQLFQGDLVTVRVGEPGVTAVVPPELDGCNCASMMICRNKYGEFDSSWLSFLMNSDVGISQIKNVQYGTAQKQFNISDAIDFLFPYPQKKEQKAIAQALSDVDTLLTALEKLITKKQAIKTATMQQLLTGKTRLPGFGDGQGMQQTELGEIPEDWGVAKISSFIGNLEAGVSVNSTDSKDIHGKDCILKTSCIYGGKFLSTEAKPIVQSDLPRARTKPRKGCIIISRMNTPDLVGEVGYVADDFGNLFLPDRLWQTVFRKDAVFDSQWLALCLSYKPIAKQIKESATGTSNSMKNISKESFLSVTVPTPNPEEQEAIAGVLSDMDAEIAALQKRLQKTKSIKQGMMQELLTGRTRLVDPTPHQPTPTKQSC